VQEKKTNRKEYKAIPYIFDIIVFKI